MNHGGIIATNVRRKRGKKKEIRKACHVMHMVGPHFRYFLGSTEIFSVKIQIMSKNFLKSFWCVEDFEV